MRSAEGLVTPQDYFNPSATQNHALGTRLMLVDGRVFRYCQAGAVDLVAGNVIQGPAPIANHLAMTPAAAALGALQVSVTPGATAGAANLYSEGYLGIDTTPGNGLTYRVASHPAILASTLFVLTLDEAIAVALTTASRVGLMANPYNDVIQTPTTKTAQVVGVAPVIIPATYYGWLQTWGPASVLINGTPAVSAPVVNGATAAGSADVWTAGAQPTASYIGEMMQLGVSGKNNFVMLKIAP